MGVTSEGIHGNKSDKGASERNKEAEVLAGGGCLGFKVKEK